jgi:hypothetical protein
MQKLQKHKQALIQLLALKRFSFSYFSPYKIISIKKPLIKRVQNALFKWQI